MNTYLCFRIDRWDRDTYVWRHMIRPYSIFAVLKIWSSFHFDCNRHNWLFSAMITTSLSPSIAIGHIRICFMVITLWLGWRLSFFCCWLGHSFSCRWRCCRMWRLRGSRIEARLLCGWWRGIILQNWNIMSCLRF